MGLETKASPESKFTEESKPIRLLDCTLRDGGHVNGWHFGEGSIKGIINRLSAARTDIIELGLLKDTVQSKEYSLQPCISAFAELAQASSPRPNQYFTVMIRPDWVRPSSIDEYSSHGLIKGIRFAFYPEDLEETIKQANIAKERGYDVFLNAVGVSCYESAQLVSTIKKLTTINPVGLSIVDTFGAFDATSLAKYYQIFEEHTAPDIAIGLHLHENRSLAFSLATGFILSKHSRRPGILDASLFGMGRIPGNLCIEQIAHHLNTQIMVNPKYDITCLLNAIESYIYPIRERYKWGYSPEYMFSALKNVNRNYPEHFIANKLELENIPKALDCIQKDQDVSFRFSKSLADAIVAKLTAGDHDS
jgi:4-hydroxy 2-oxovalerate aldolase